MMALTDLPRAHEPNGSALCQPETEMVVLTNLPTAHKPETVLYCADHLYQNIYAPQLGLFKAPLEPKTENVLLAAV